MNKSRMLKNYGHNCIIPTKQLEDRFAIRYNTSRKCISKLCGFLRKYFLVDELNMRVSKYCRSEYSLHMERRKHLKQAPNIIHPLSAFKQWWENIMIMVFAMVLTLTPFGTTFSLLPQISNVYMWQDFPRIVLDIFCILDIFIQFRTGFYDHEHAINLKSKDIANSWITYNGVWNSSSTLMYVTALFRTSCIMSNAQYGLINDSTVADELLVCILWTVSRILTIAMVCLLIQVARSLTSSQTKYKEMVLQLKQYMHHKQLSAYTQNRLISYYEFRFQKSFFRDEEILNTISVQLRQEILMLKCLKLVENVPFFKGLPQSLLMRIVLSLELEIFLINDVIIKAMSKGTCMYFIGTGTVAVYTETGKEIYHLHDGQHFGEVEIVMPEIPRIMSVVAIEPCETYRFERKDFLQIIRPYPELLITIEQIATEKIQLISAIEEKHRYFRRQKYLNRLNDFK